MKLFTDTCVWSLAFRRDRPPEVPEVAMLAHALEAGELIVTTGLVLQELLQGFRGPKAAREIRKRFSALPMLVPDLEDHVEAAELRNLCRRRGAQIGTIDALIAQMCIRHTLTLLTTDRDFKAVAAHTSLKLWKH
ncbi:MAG: PIN domain-containing protein [Planctomycetes bacterium]|nr:PIN domain-containing protein [Planctomycetota bacterium]